MLATHHARYRKAFGSTLIEAPLMRNALVDLAVESEAAVASGWRWYCRVRCWCGTPNRQWRTHSPIRD
ncbi:hypothetical protein I1A62_21730 [Rhodococcus sp. USK10]|uniref:acyl-CoA dehydrogenase family protein n=1 Tax=Rhodococcus sp. USK10 TaxID=2789739 RepID=UPI001C5DC9F0|nr:hypothetical protein I1A62_21730 [Rhodococcus sp. USK10]